MGVAMEDKREERVFLKENGVTVTNARYVFNTKGGQPQTVALSGINSVTTAKQGNKWFGSM